MRDVLDALLTWQRAGEVAGLATVTATWSSAPRRPGAMMAVGPDGTAIGSVSGGCVEAAVYDLCREAAATGRARSAEFGVTDDDALEVGLPCGGVVELRVEPVGPDALWLAALIAEIDAGRPAALLTRLEGDSPRHLLLTQPSLPPSAHSAPVVPPSSTHPAPAAPPSSTDPASALTPPSTHPTPADSAPSASAVVPSAPSHPGMGGEPPDRVLGTLGSEQLDQAAIADARRLVAAGETEIVRYGPDEGVLVVSFVPPPRMIVFGATEHAAATARAGSFLGFRVTVCDARPVFATERRLPAADEVVVDWPHRYLAAEAAAGRVDERTAICVLTHDPRFDVPALEVALRLPVAYVGAMGSRRTHDDRLRRLREAGVTDAEVAKLASPIGLDLGARTPEETAVSIAAEIVALRRGGSGGRLRETDGPIQGSARPE